jgi:pimeloyl-ACP methyl ester carboxylesterase
MSSLHRPDVQQVGPNHASTTVDLEGPVHIASWGKGAPVFVLIHGLAGSHLNWMAVAPRLAERGAVLAPDLPGFGLSPGAGRDTGVRAQRRLVHRVLTRFLERPVVLVGNSLGGLVALAEAGLHPENVAGLILVDAAVPVPGRTRPDHLVTAAFSAYMVPPLGRRLVRRYLDRHNPEEVVAGAFALCSVDPVRIPKDVVAAHVALEKQRLGRRVENDRSFVNAARSLALIHLADAPVQRLVARISSTTLVIHGDRDRLVNVESARALVRCRPDWTLRVIEDAGHIPMLEVPDRFLIAVESWLDEHGLAPRPVARKAGRSRSSCRPAGGTQQARGR